MKRGKYFTDYSRWYGIYGIEFIWHGEWSDPEIRYRRYCFSSYLVEDAMVEIYRYEVLDDTDMVGFYDWMYANRDRVREMCQYVVDNRHEFKRVFRC